MPNNGNGQDLEAFRFTLHVLLPWPVRFAFEFQPFRLLTSEELDISVHIEFV